MKALVKFIKADRVPIVVSLFGLLMGVGGTIIGITALFDPTTAIDFVDGADKMGIAWGGRNLGLGFAMIAAFLLRHAAGYAAAFSGAIWREVSDLSAGLSDGGSLNIPFALILVLELVCLAICVQATLALRKQEAAAAAVSV